jgi:hypothetical protein
MAFIGNTNTTQAFTPAVDYFSGNASTTAFTLSRPVASVAQVQAVVNNVAQNPSDAFTVSGSIITFTSAPSSGTNNIYVYYTSPITQVIAPGQGTVTTTSLTSGFTLPVASGGTGLTTVPHTVTVYTSGSGTYTTPANVKAIFVQCWGGGGSGAAGNTSTSTRGSGAGAGSYSQKLINSPAATYSYAVGAGAAAVTSTAGGANGNTGGTTTFGTALLSCAGGVGGNLGANAGGAGGATPTGGDLNIAGQAGMVGQNGGATTFMTSGGSSPMGGPGGQTNVSAAGETPGGGGACSNHTASSPSGIGGSGTIIITEYYV